jgi:pyruvate dehydrogenase (quinone)
VFLANTPKQVMNGLQTAIQHTIGQRCVALLGLPGDVASAEIEEVLIAGKFFYSNL